MRLTVSGWFRHAGLVAAMALAVSCASVANSAESDSAENREEPAVVQTADETARPMTATAAVPTLAPRREPVSQIDSAKPAAESSAATKSESDTPQETAAAGQESAALEPIPDPEASLTVEVATASFNGVIPGATTLAELQTSWGTASKTAKRGDTLVYLYSIDPFERVEVGVRDDKVTSIVIRLDRAFPAATVAEQLEMTNVRPVLVSNPMGEILGQAFPERGVLLAFRPDAEATRPSMQVSEIILEPVTAEPFVLRAETYLESQLERSLADLEQAIKLDAEDARARWLYARALAVAGRNDAALEAAAAAVRLAPADVQYRTTYAEILGQAERFDEAVKEAKKAVAESSQRPHIQARALCLLGDLLASGSNPDYAKAIDYHMKAITAAEPLIDAPHPAIHTTAKEVTLDAHLGAAHDVGWGNWNQKELSVSRWLERASELAKDVSKDEQRANEYRFRVAQRAMAAQVGLQGQADPAHWVEEVVQSGQATVAAAPDALKRRQILGQMGAALYDAVQIYQMRGENDAATNYGRQAVDCLEQVTKDNDDPAQSYLLGRLYFRLGAIQAIGNQDHQQAAVWFDKALAVFDRVVDRIGPGEAGRLGETLVSMGVSYWEAGQHEKGAEITGRGVELIELAVDEGKLDKTALEIPYGNLAVMKQSPAAGNKGEAVAESSSRDKKTSLK